MRLDLSYLIDITGGDKEMMLEMIDLFLEDIPIQIMKIKSLSGANNLKQLGKEAHKLKPTLQYVGFVKMHEAVIKLELISKSGIYTSEIDELIEQTIKYSEIVLPILKEQREEYT